MTSYEKAGVDIAAGERAVELMKKSIQSTHRPEVIGGIGGFSGYFDASKLKEMRNPVLVTSTDGVGTKTEIARELGDYSTIGQDLVAMVVDDLVVCGAEPLFMTDYIAIGKVIPERVAELVSGIARGCAIAKTALIGGETAEHPGLLEGDEFDVAGAATGVVERDEILGPERIDDGDTLIAIASSGVHANGFSMVRHIIRTNSLSLDLQPPGFSQDLGRTLLTPTTIYAQACLSLTRELGDDIHGFAHITGGGIAKNTERVIPEHLKAIIDRSTWELPQIFNYLAGVGDVPRSELELTFNCGVGMVAIVKKESAEKTLEVLQKNGNSAWIAGTISKRQGAAGAELIGSYR